MRLIDADVLKEIVGECPENWTDSPEEAEAFNMWHRIMDDIDSVPTVDTDINVLSKWISVKERLPELHRYEEDGDIWLMSAPVLVATTKGVTIGYYEDDLDPKFKPCWNDREHGEKIKVTHWMELPEMPKVSK